MENSSEKEVIIRPCFHKELAAAYGVSTKVLRTWLKPYLHEIGKRNGYYYSLEQLFIIFEKIGYPVNPIEKTNKNPQP